MKIGIAGAGAVGCHYGSLLQQAGFDVLLLARGAHLEALQARGLRHDSDGRSVHVPVCATADVSELASCDVVMLTCKMTALATMLDALQPVLSGKSSRATLLVTWQNGVEAPFLVSEIFPDHAVAAGTAFIGARIEHPGHVIHSAAGGVRMGLWQGGEGGVLLEPLHQAFAAAAVPVRLEQDARLMLWRKLLWNCGFNALTAITRRYAKDVAANSETLKIIQQSMQETVAVAQAEGMGLSDEDIDKHIRVTLEMGAVKTSMWQDIEAGRLTEVDYINGYVVKKGDELSIDVSVNRMLMALLHAIEAS